MKVQVHSSSDHHLNTINLVTTFLTNLGVMEILYSFRLVLEGEKSKVIPESSRSGFLEKFFSKQFLLYQMQKTTPRGC